MQLRQFFTWAVASSVWLNYSGISKNCRIFHFWLGFDYLNFCCISKRGATLAFSLQYAELFSDRLSHFSFRIPYFSWRKITNFNIAVKHWWIIQPWRHLLPTTTTTSHNKIAHIRVVPWFAFPQFLGMRKNFATPVFGDLKLCILHISIVRFIPKVKCLVFMSVVVSFCVWF